ncbi:nitrite reductase/ring-hydroxylating ferredoxin subunit [Kribbella antiqua]|uniref:Nitrite reductase/ring-hydroxylating ferredoxin subunit n=1 Tax=Kribbella antiqua TaxID=2512217 RepID=A0A4R2IW89_9ACTN|nr:Rieske (2Fe-2S) protein [Kribbella antiqua]TCO50061.1 nitrite reductase/ring-hydroxylating ferredoxin subunit [Kribbella antiqua]
MSDTTAPQSTPEVDALRDRRSVLRCAAMVALAGASAPLLAACGGSDDAGSSSSTGTTGTSSAPASTTPTTGTSTTPSATSGGGTVLGPTSDVPVGGGKVFTDAKVVVTQPTAGQYKGFSAVCTHQGNPIGSVEGGQIVCPFHNSHFSITDGSPVSGPAQTALPAVKVAVQGSNIVQSA